MKVDLKKKVDADKGKVCANLTNAEKIELIAKRLGLVDKCGNVKHVDDWLDDLDRRLQK
jgi:cell division protein FtsL